MRMSCNGCRVLRKGCSDNCSIRPCLQWIKSPDSQANATVFLAKFYGRAGLINLITAGPDHLRPAIFRSLLYEACGRIVNPIYGSVGLLWSGNWQLCQAAVEAVLRGAPITPITSDAALNTDGPPLKAYDIRHVSKDDNSAASNDQHKVRTRCRFKRNAGGSSSATARACKPPAVEPLSKNRSTSHESSLSHQSELAANVDGDSREIESTVSEETAELSVLFRAESQSPSPPAEQIEVRGNSSLLQEQEGDIGLELTLGFEPVARVQHPVPVKKRRFEERWSKSGGACKMELGLMN